MAPKDEISQAFTRVGRGAATGVDATDRRRRGRATAYVGELRAGGGICHTLNCYFGKISWDGWGHIGATYPRGQF